MDINFLERERKVINKLIFIHQILNNMRVSSYQELIAELPDVLKIQKHFNGKLNVNVLGMVDYYRFYCYFLADDVKDSVYEKFNCDVVDHFYEYFKTYLNGIFGDVSCLDFFKTFLYNKVKASSVPEMANIYFVRNLCANSEDINKDCILINKDCILIFFEWYVDNMLNYLDSKGIIKEMYPNEYSDEQIQEAKAFDILATIKPEASQYSNIPRIKTILYISRQNLHPDR